MCGIVGYAGERDSLGILLDGLQTLEYRGYDSAGVAVVTGEGLWTVRRAGKVAQLVEATEKNGAHGTVGIGHTRWATCGVPIEKNAHPHHDCTGSIALVHNGIIENHVALRERLSKDGHSFSSDTDSEVVVHLVETHLAKGGSLAEATRRAVSEVEGSYALAIVSASEPSTIVGARKDAPLVVGLAEGETFLASDVTALIEHTRRVVVLEDGQVAEITAQGLKVFDPDGNTVPFDELQVTWDHEAAEKGGFPHFMLKEIHEQPGAFRDTLRGRSTSSGIVALDEMRMSAGEVRAVDKVFIVACGSSYYAGLVAKYAIERWTRVPVEIDIASEFRYRDPVLDERTLVIGISQSGETADTLAAVRYARGQGAKVVVVTNVMGSSITREADAVLYTHAGPEVGVTATKTLTSQMGALWLIALWMAQCTGSLAAGAAGEILDQLWRLPDQMEEVLSDDTAVMRIAERFQNAPSWLFIGRGVGVPVALEGALKLKEISYLHAEGFAAGEMKHGPIALIEPGVPVVAIATQSLVQSKVLSNIEEAATRGAHIIAVANPGDEPVAALAGDLLEVPAAAELLSAVIDVIPLQLLAYHVAVLRGSDPDRPRNLAKSVTVE